MQGTSLRRSLALSFAERYGSLAINVAAVVILARLLTPAQIGVYSVAAAFLALAQVLREFGIGNYLIQEKELTEERIRTAFGVAIVVAWTIAALLFLMSAPVAAFYGEPGMQQVLRLLCLTFIVLPFATPVLALLRREMAFGALLRINLAATAVQAATGVTLASLGHGYMSLAWAALAGAVTTSLAASLHRPALGRTLPSLKEWRRVSAFGGYASGAGLVVMIGMNSVDLVIGRLLGFAAVGLYSRARGLITFFNDSVMASILPVAYADFAAAHRRGGDLARRYLGAMTYVTAIAWPFFGFVGLLAEPIIRVLFGPQWVGAAPIAQALCAASAIYALYSFSGPILVGTGKIKRLLVSESIIQSARLVIVVLASFHGIVAVAASQILVHAIAFAVFYHGLHRIIGIRLSDYLVPVMKSGAVSASAILPAALAVALVNVDPDHAWLPVIIAGCASAVLWLWAVSLVRHPIREEVRLFMAQYGRRLIGSY